MTRGPSDYSYLRRPKWVAGHLLALIAIAVFVQLGFWQLRRLEERRDTNATVEARLTAAYQPLPELIEAHGADPVELVWRRVEVSGVYDTDEEVIVQGRVHLGQSGHHVVTPLVTAAGTAVIVNRGWVPIDTVGPPVVGGEPPEGQVVVRGVVRESQVRGRIGPIDAESGVLERLARVDVSRLQSQSEYTLYGFYVDLEEQAPAQPLAAPAPLEAPVLSEGSHLSYAIQWFIFAALVVGGYPVLLYRTAQPTARPPEERA